ncbi:MAG: hypothetical protein EPN93_18320, partial [Spirochaetes bacterium]
MNALGSSVNLKILATVLFLTAACLPAQAGQILTIAVTSNLEGRFSPDEKNQDDTDPLLLIAQGIQAERRAGRADLYLDMGNAFYPGALSKYSMGSVMMDYLEYFGCEASLVSSGDLGIRAESLAFLQEGKKTRLLSANLMKGDARMFAPYVLVPAGGGTVALVGLSSHNARVDVAEERVHNIKLAPESEALGAALAEIRAARPDARVILLSGLGMKDTIALLAAFPGIGLALCGGDGTGALYGGTASRIDLADGRSILCMPDAGGYYLASLELDEKITVRSVVRKEAAPAGPRDMRYLEFTDRLSLWKKKYREEEDIALADTGGREITLDDAKLLALLRERYGAEVAALDKGTLTASTFKGPIRNSDILRGVNQDNAIFIYTLSGDDLRKIMQAADGPELQGIRDDMIAGYPLEAARPYRVASTQAAHARISRILQGDIPYENSWQYVTELLALDLQGEGTVLRDDHAYIERRFRMTVDVVLSNFLDNSLVQRSESLEAPPGKPTETYHKWGMENRIDVTVYNRYHQFIFTPYMLYIKQDELYLQNLLRGTFVYNLNLHEIVKPYHKSQCDTVVRETNGERPVVIRETLGSNFIWKTFSAKLGAGFEKPVHEPVGSPRYGIET